MVNSQKIYTGIQVRKIFHLDYMCSKCTVIINIYSYIFNVNSSKSKKFISTYVISIKFPPKIRCSLVY